MILLQEYSMRLGCAFLAGTIIGLERQCRQRNAGLRTNVLVSIGAAAFTAMSYAVTEPGYGDPTRIAAQIVSGIGFLGGGLILKEGINVRGLNTAATIWCSAACGTLAGIGMYIESLILVGCIIAAHCLLRPLGKFINLKASRVCEYNLKVECLAEQAEKIRQIIMEVLAFDKNAHSNSFSYTRKDEGYIIIDCEIEVSANDLPILDLISSRLNAQFGISNTGWSRKKVSQSEF